MMLWLARDENGDLYLYNYKPKRYDKMFGIMGNPSARAIKLDADMFPQVNWNNSPKECELTLKARVRSIGSEIKPKGRPRKYPMADE